MKTVKQLEQYFKGIANHRRIEILVLVNKQAGISLEQMAGQLNCSFKTLSEHTRRLVHAGFMEKKYQGRQVAHTLLPCGKKIVKIIQSF